MLFEPQAYAGAAAHNIIPMYAGHEINAYFAENPIYVVSPSTSSLTLEGVGPAKGRAQALLATTSAAYAKDSLHYTSSEQTEQDAAGQFTVAAIAEGSVFVCGSRMIYADDLMATSSYANRMFLTRVVNALYSESVAVSIPAKTLDSALLAVSAGQARALGEGFHGKAHAAASQLQHGAARIDGVRAEAQGSFQAFKIACGREQFIIPVYHIHSSFARRPIFTCAPSIFVLMYFSQSIFA